MKFKQTTVYDVYRNGVIHKSFSALQTALNYLAVARELRPEDLWQIKECDLSLSQQGSDR